MRATAAPSRSFAVRGRDLGNRRRGIAGLGPLTFKPIARGDLYFFTLGRNPPGKHSKLRLPAMAALRAACRGKRYKWIVPAVNGPLRFIRVMTNEQRGSVASGGLHKSKKVGLFGHCRSRTDDAPPFPQGPPLGETQGPGVPPV